MSLQGRRLRAFYGAHVTSYRTCPVCMRIVRSIEGGATVPGPQSNRRLGPCGHVVAVDTDQQFVALDQADQDPPP